MVAQDAMAAVANCLDKKIIAGAFQGLEKAQTWSLYKNAKEGAGSTYQKAKTVKEGAGLIMDSIENGIMVSCATDLICVQYNGVTNFDLVIIGGECEHPKREDTDLNSSHCNHNKAIAGCARVYEKKLSFVKWDNVLASKEKGGLGISSYFALNRALTFKWIWRFRSQDSSLWSKVIKSIHGEDGKISNIFKHDTMSNWNNITRGVTLLHSKGIDLGYIKKKTGNGENTLFWNEAWKGGIEQLQMDNLMSNLEGYILPNMHDRWRWSLSGNGNFSVASVRNLIDDKILDVTPSLAPLVPWAGGNSTKSIFFGCSMAKDVYKFIARWWDVSMPTVSSYDEWWNWFFNLRVTSKIKMLFEGMGGLDGEYSFEE
ncbi:hypothetical protein Tco_0281679 [Tanacetum coccineum]